jgi:hypothetical protein
MKLMQAAFVLCVLFIISPLHAQSVPRPVVPAQALAEKGAVIFTDDFERTELAPWTQNCQTFTVAGGVMKGSQTRDDHGAVGAIAAAFGDAIIEFKFRFEGAASINAVCDDKAFTGSHAGHICRATITPKVIRLGDDKEGGMRNDIFKLRRDPRTKVEGDKMMAGRTLSFPTSVESGRWYRCTMEMVGEEMRVLLDDKPVGYLKSPGIAHATKSHFHFTVSGRDALFDDVRIHAAKPAASK